MLAFHSHFFPSDEHMSKYMPLADYLRAHCGDTCSLSFLEVEQIIGCSLPTSARERRSWWGNDRTHTQARAWMQAGFGAEPSSRRIEPVVFRRVRAYPVPPTPAETSGPTQVVVRNLDPGVVAALKRRASRAGRSLERELRIILSRNARPDRSDLIGEADRIRAMTPAPLSDSTKLLRQDRDRR